MTKTNNLSAIIYILALANVATDVESNIKEIIDMWKEDEKKDNEFQVCSQLFLLWCCLVYFWQFKIKYFQGLQLVGKRRMLC